MADFCVLIVNTLKEISTENENIPENSPILSFSFLRLKCVRMEIDEIDFICLLCHRIEHCLLFRYITTKHSGLIYIPTIKLRISIQELLLSYLPIVYVL